MDRASRRCAATSLVLVLMLIWVPLARAHGNGALTKQYPLGSQTLCCKGGSGQAKSDSTTKKTGASTPRSPSAGSTKRGNGGISILLVVVIAVIAVTPVPFIFRAELSSLGRGTPPEPEPDLEPGAEPAAEPEPDSNMEPTTEPEPSTSEA